MTKSLKSGRRLVALLLVMILVILPLGVQRTAHAASDVRIDVNGSFLKLDQPPIIKDGRTLAPLRAIFEALDASVEWDNATKTVTAYWPGNSMSLTIGSDYICMGSGGYVELDVPAQIINSRTLIPLRAVAESIGADVQWDGAERIVVIRSTPVETVTVSKTEDLIKAIGSNKHIKLAAGTYNLGDWMRMVKNNGTWARLKLEPAYQYIDIQDVYDGFELRVSNVNNMTIEPAVAGTHPEIIVDASYADVIGFYECSNILMNGIVMGHEVTGDCTGNVVYGEICENMVFNDMDLYGCGVIGVVFNDSYGIQVMKSVIRDCSEGAVQLYDTYNARFTDTVFRGTNYYTLLSLYESTAVFDFCTFVNNTPWSWEYSSFLNLDPEVSFADFENCDFDSDSRWDINQMLEDPTYDNALLVAVG